MSADSKYGSNPGRYREMCVPHEDAEAMSRAYQAFADAVSDARVKYRIADVYVIAKMHAYVGEGDDEGAAMLTSQFGNSSEALHLLAYAYGYEKRAREENLARLLAGKKKEGA